MRQLLLGITAGGALWADFAFGIVFFAVAAAVGAWAYPRAILQAALFETARPPE